MPTEDNTTAAADPERRGSVLVVDDEEGVRAMLRVALSREGYDVSTASDAKEAIACVADQHPMVAILDINIPGTDGLQLCRRFTREDALEVVLITGDDRNYSFDDAADAGACDFLLKPIRLSELVLRVERALATRRLRMERDETLRELRRLSLTDDLTGLYNSRHFMDQVQRELARAGRYGHAVSLIVLDLDHFKRVNDSHGHQEGDRVLRRVADALQRSIREPDTAYRCGGEEFAVIVPETTGQSATVLAKRILAATAIRVNGTGGPPIDVTASLGIAQWQGKEDAWALVHRADMAMYEAKRAGRNRIVTAAPAQTAEEPAP
jgi:diguanylate cyclase (GGDEF)-like protein